MSSIQGKNGQIFNQSTGGRRRVVGMNICNFSNLTTASGFVATDNYSVSSRYHFVPTDDVFNLAMVFLAGSAAATISGGEKQQVSPNIITGTFESPDSQPVVRASAKSGPTTWVLTPGGAMIETEAVGIVAKKGVTFHARTFFRVPKAPLTPTATAIAGGSLGTTTTKYYVLTVVDNGVESGPTAEFSGTTGGSTTLALSVAWAWAAAAYGDTVRVYRSDAAAGTKQLLGEAAAKGGSFIDWGVVTPNSAINPPAAQLTIRGKVQQLQTGDSGNTPANTGNGLDRTGATGVISDLQGPVGAFVGGADLIIGEGSVTPTFGVESDSIGAGVGNDTNTGTKIDAFNQIMGSYAAQAFNPRGLSWYNFSIAGSQSNWFNDGTHVASMRESIRKYCDYLFSNQGTNDLGAGRTWQQLAVDTMLRAKAAVSAGPAFIPQTVGPRTTSTDNWTSVGAQTVTSIETDRKNYNNWLRNGFQVDGSGNPVLTGGTRYKWLWLYHDLANVLEVNATNVPAQDGGFCKVPSAARYTGLVLTGSPTTTAFTVTGTPFTAASNSDRGIAGHAIKMTSGAAIGQVGIVATNGANTVTVYGNGSTTLTGVALKGMTVAPAAGDTFDVFEIFFVDGLHPAFAGHAAIGADMNTNYLPKVLKV